MGKEKSHKHEQHHNYELTKHQLSRQEKQKKRQRIFLIVGICVISAVAGVLGGGYYRDEYLPLHEEIIQVNDTSVEMVEYVNILKVQSDIYQQMYGTEQLNAYLLYVADQIETFIEQTELTRQAAADLGVTVGSSEVATALKESDPPLGKEYRYLMERDLLVQQLLDDVFNAQVPLLAPQRDIMVMLLESESVAEEIRAKLVAGEDFATLNAEYSLEEVSENGDGDLGWYPQGILGDILGLSAVENYAFAANVGDLSQPIYDEGQAKGVGYWLVEVTETDEDASGELYHVFAMLLGSDEEAENVRARLEAGESFTDLASELSQDDITKQQAGDLGLLTPDAFLEPVKSVVENAEVGVLSEPVRDDTVSTTGGYWLVNVVGEEDNRRITDEFREILKARAFDLWVDTLWANPDNVIVSTLDDAKKQWAVSKALGG